DRSDCHPQAPPSPAAAGTGRSSSGMTRLAASERRAALLDTACQTFAQGSYRGTTTAEIAREAGISEPILYRHFASKRDLYLACLEDMWTRVRAGWEEALAAEPDESACLTAMGRSFQHQ